jgi:hypothetical protein
MTERKAVQLVLDELARATRKFGVFHSAHEGYAVIAEELDELWDEVKKNKGGVDYSAPVARCRMAREAIQVAAMALRFLVDVTFDSDLTEPDQNWQTDRSPQENPDS